MLYSVVKVMMPINSMNTYLAMGDFLSCDNDEIRSFSTLVGNYLRDKNYVENTNNNYTMRGIDSSSLLKMIVEDTYSGKDDGLSSLIKESKYLSISVGLNDILRYIKFDSSNKEMEYDKEFIKRKLEIMKQNYLEIIEEIKQLNEGVSVYLVGYYCPFMNDNGDKIDGVEVFNLLNEYIRDVSELTSVYYLDIEDVSSSSNMLSKNNMYLNQEGHNYIYNAFLNAYFC